MRSNAIANPGFVEALGSRIRAARLRANLSQEALARRADCSTAYVRVIESAFEPRDGDAFRRVLAVVEQLEASG